MTAVDHSTGMRPWKCEVSPGQATDLALGFHLDRPTGAEQGEGCWLVVAGWVVGRHAEAEEVQIHFDGSLLRRATVDYARPDVGEAFPSEPAAGTSGFRTHVGLLGLPPTARLEVIVRLADGTHVLLGSIAIDRPPVVTRSRPQLSPVLVTSLGRMGTTWLMRLLSFHPGLLVYGTYPYELGIARYWAHAARVMADPADHLDSSHPETFSAQRSTVGHNPFFGDFLAGSEPLNDWLGAELPDLVGSFLHQAVDGFYGRVRPGSSGGRRLFAEKSLPDEVPDVMRSFYPDGREIFLVRDIRDVICSVISFNEKRGQASFGRDLLEDDFGFIAQLRQDLERLIRSWERRRHDALLVRYESLVRDPVVTMSAVFTYLGLDNSPEVVDAVIDQASQTTPDLEAHRTTSDPAASIGRWRKDLAERDPNLMARCDELFRPLLETLGYQTSRPGARAADLERALEAALGPLGSHGDV